MAHRRKHFKIYSIFFLTSILLVRQQQQWIAREGQKGPSRFGNFAGFFDKFFLKKKVDNVVFVVVLGFFKSLKVVVGAVAFLRLCETVDLK